MNFQLKHRGVDVPDGLKQSIDEKVSRFERLLPDNAYLEIELIHHDQHHAGQEEAEVILDLPGQKQVVRFRAGSSTLLAAVDIVLDKLDEEVGRIKDKSSDHSYKGRPPKEWLADQMNQEQLSN